MSSISDAWNAIPDNELTVESVRNTLQKVEGNDLWVAAACFDRLVDDTSVQRVLLDIGIERTRHAVERAKAAYALPTNLPENDSVVISCHKENGETEDDKGMDSLVAHFHIVQDDAQLCRLRDLLLERLDRLNTFVEMTSSPETTDVVGDAASENNLEDDPWAETGDSARQQIQDTTELPVPLSVFLSDDLNHTACLFASLQRFSALRILLYRHGTQLWFQRFAILDVIPEHSQPAEYVHLLPSFDASTDREFVPTTKPWRADGDWCQSREVRTALQQPGVNNPIPFVTSESTEISESLTAAELTGWYRERVNRIISSTGIIDISLSMVQHGASQDVPDLDELGEDLSLLSRLVYDAPGADLDVVEDWTLEHWKSMDPPAIVHAYLAHSTPDTIASDITRLVMPYLYVLEARAERSGQPDPALVYQLLYNYILTTPLGLVSAIFEASKPTLPSTQRIIHNDEDMVRLALSCLYGNSRLDEWATMSAIFECLPAWDVATADGNDGNAAEETLDSLGAFVAPSTTRPQCTPSDLLAFFKPLPIISLSHALDVLDVHLESGEMLSKWQVPAPLRWFLQSRSDASAQRAWATKMSRRAGDKESDLNTQEDWECLYEDMLKLATSGETGIRGAFGLMTQNEIARTFLSGLLSRGKFSIAKVLLNSPTYKYKIALDPNTVEEICISCSREFYDNASSGNYKVGDMKLAYDCLEVPSFSAQLLREKNFIEATSRLSTFNIMSRAGIPISPLEIRLTKDRLSLVSRVLSINPDAYKHTQVILDLVYKLGFINDVVAEVKTFAMIADTALQVEDFTRAFEANERMVAIALRLRDSPPAADELQQVKEVCWMACFQLGRQPEFDDAPKKMLLLGRALELCPSDKLYDILMAYHKLEKEDIASRQESLATHRGDHSTNKPSTKSSTLSLAARLQDIHIASSTLAHAPDIASRTFNRVAATFPFSVGSRGRDRATNDNERSRSGSRRRPDGGDVSVQATRVLQKGIGWLIGVDE